MEDITPTILNVYRYDSPAIYSSEELNTIQELVGFIKYHQNDNEQQSFYGASFAKVTKEDFDLMCKIIIHLVENERLPNGITEQSVLETYRDELTSYAETNNDERVKRMLEADVVVKSLQLPKQKGKLRV